MSVQFDPLFDPGNPPLPVAWHNSAWHPRIIVRRGYHRSANRSAAFRPQNPRQIFAFHFHGAVIKLQLLRPEGRAPLPAVAGRALLSSARRSALESNAWLLSPAGHLPRPWPRRTFIFSRLPCYPPAQLAKLASL